MYGGTRPNALRKNCIALIKNNKTVDKPGAYGIIII